MNKINSKHVDTKPEDYFNIKAHQTGTYEHDPSVTEKHLKADLIRRNLLSRKDLMNMYKLP
jgi:hypothetical protein